MRISARNQIKGTVVEVKKGATTSHVRVDIGNGQIITSSITNEAVAAREARELERRERAYRGERPPPSLRDRTVILVDDGLATGATMRAAVQAAKITASPQPA